MHARQVYVEQRDVDRLALEDPKTIFAVVDRENLVPLPLEQLSEQ